MNTPLHPGTVAKPGSPADAIFAIALAEITRQRDEAKEFCADLTPYANLDFNRAACVAVAERMMAWYIDKRKHQWLWCFAHEAIVMGSPTTFLANLNNFIGNCLLDDSQFRIEWRKNKLTKDFDVVWDKNGNPMTVKTTPNEKTGSARPHLFRHHADTGGSQDPALIMAAMDEIERREIAYEAEYNEEMDFGLAEAPVGVPA